MKPNSEVKKVKARKRDLATMEIQELEGFTNFVLGKVRKVGRAKVLESYKTQFALSPHFWLKEMYLKVIDHAQDVRLKNIQTKTKVEGEMNVTVMGTVKVDSVPLVFDIG